VYLAQKTGATILPVALHGTEDRVVKSNLRCLKRSKFVLRAGEPYTLPPISGNDRQAYLAEHTDELMCRIAALLPQKYRGVYADHPRLHALLAQGYGQEM
jgi:1-acyl-sn-glycerol-3-phosphate acyltransferase